MFVQGYKNPLSYKQYIYLVNMLGLKRDPQQGYWYGFWPIFVLPNGELFTAEFP